jgi:hypothetical protein
MKEVLGTTWLRKEVLKNVLTTMCLGKKVMKKWRTMWFWKRCDDKS